MNKKNIAILTLLSIFLMFATACAVSASDNATNSEVISTSNDTDNTLQISNENQNLSMVKKDSLSTTATVSNGRTYHVMGYTFSLNANQHTKVKKIINTGKKQELRNEYYHIKVPTNKMIKVKVPNSKKIIKARVYAHIWYDGREWKDGEKFYYPALYFKAAKKGVCNVDLSYSHIKKGYYNKAGPSPYYKFLKY